MPHNPDCPIGCGPECQVDEYASIGTRCGTFGTPEPPAPCRNCGHATLHTSGDYSGCPDKIVCNWHRQDAGGDGYYCHCCVYDPVADGLDSEHWAFTCRNGRHPSFWATVTTSPQWVMWEQEIARRMKTGKRPVWDIGECNECGWISAAHFGDFLNFLNPKMHRSFSDPIPVALALVVGLTASYFGGWLPGLAGAGFGAMVGLLTRGWRR